MMMMTTQMMSKLCEELVTINIRDRCMNVICPRSAGVEYSLAKHTLLACLDVDTHFESSDIYHGYIIAVTPAAHPLF